MDEFLLSLPDWYETQMKFTLLNEALRKNEKENFLSDEDKQKLIKDWKNHYWMLNREPVNSLPI